MADLTVSPAQLELLEATLLNASGSVPLHARFRALFTLKALKSQDAIRIISKGFQDDSALLKHELAYCLGQIKDATALPTLEAVLADETQDPMVRHEAAEAMGAIAHASSLPVLRRYCADTDRAVRETCEIALARIEWEHSDEGRAAAASSAEPQTYTSIDPAPPTLTSGLLKGKLRPKDSDADASVANLRATLLDTARPLFERYRAMFALRNIGSPAAVDALAGGFGDDSALFKHEIAFVFGQLLSPHSVPALSRVLQDATESDMVRHEAAEALGGIATPDVLPLLQAYAARADAPLVVRQSCEVALDMYEYENSDQFQYADGLGAGAAAMSVGA